MRDFWKSSSSWLKPKSWRRKDEARHDQGEEQDNLLPPKRSRRQTWLMSDGLRRSNKLRPSSIAVDGRFSGFDFGFGDSGDAGDGRNNHNHNHNHSSNRGSAYLEFLVGDSSHSSTEKVEFRDPTNVRYSSFFDHMVSWDRFM